MLRGLVPDLEGPNISNVFKRTFYQMLFKFRLAGQGACAGAAWRYRPPFGTVGSAIWPLQFLPSCRRYVPASPRTSEADTKAWIYVFDIDTASKKVPTPIVISKIIATDADAVAHFAFKAAPMPCSPKVGQVRWSSTSSGRGSPRGGRNRPTKARTEEAPLNSQPSTPVLGTEDGALAQLGRVRIRLAARAMRQPIPLTGFVDRQVERDALIDVHKRLLVGVPRWFVRTQRMTYSFANAFVSSMSRCGL